MMKRIIPFFLVCACVLVAGIMAGCSTNSNGETTRTFPEAFSYRTIPFAKFQDKIAPPDSINLKVYVNAVSECPPGAYCILASGIEISDSLHPVSNKSTYRLAVRKPSQFEKGKFYQLSLKVGTYPGNRSTDIRLVGYSLIKQTE